MSDWLLLPIFIMMPDTQDYQSATMQSVTYNILAEDEISYRFRVWRLRNISPHLGKGTKVVEAFD